jgi:hypothetical protein
LPKSLIPCSVAHLPTRVGLNKAGGGLDPDQSGQHADRLLIEGSVESFSMSDDVPIDRTIPILGRGFMPDGVAPISESSPIAWNGD